MKVFIIIPTYNERENIGPLVEALAGEFKGIGDHQMNILVVDGQSPDGTALVVENLRKAYPNLYLLSVPKGGLGTDYIKGMRHAIHQLGAEIVVEMDADFQHDPRYLKEFLRAVDEGYDYVLGSRFIKGGSIPKDWGFHRKFLSRFGNLFARLVLWHPHLHDITTGFKASRVKGFLDRIDLMRILSKSYAYKIHLLDEMVKGGARVKEVPIDFLSRERGSSKMDLEDFFESLRVVLTLRYRRNEEFFKVCGVGVIGAAIQWSFFEGLTRLGAYPPNANALGVEVAIVSNFFINNFWTFKKKSLWGKPLPFIFSKFLQFNFLSGGSLLIQYLVMRFGLSFFGQTFLVRQTLFVTGILLGLTWNFSFYRKVIWKAR